jgi:hypothetical protein
MEEVKVTKFLKGECYIHGETDFYIYKEEAHKCVVCTKKKSKEWSLKNHKYVKQYSIKYNELNQERIKHLSNRNKEISRRKTLENHDNFYKKFGDYIEEIASKILLKKIPDVTKFKLRDNPTKDKILEILIKSKRAQLTNYERYRASSMVKWNHLKSLNMEFATEEQKSIIRAEYKIIAQKVVDAEMEKIIKNII